MQARSLGAASGLFNVARTVGGSAGVVILVAMLSIDSQVHQTYPASHVDAFRLCALVHSVSDVQCWYFAPAPRATISLNPCTSVLTGAE